MKTKTSILLAAIIALSMISVPSFSQVKLRIKGEIGLNKPEHSGETFSVEHTNAFKIGPTIELIHPTVGLGIESSLLYSNEKITVKEFALDETIFEASNHNITVPVNLKYKIGTSSQFKIFLATGPYVQFNLSGSEFDWEELTETFENKTFQVGLNAGLGFELINSIQLGVNYRLTLTDNYAVNHPDWKHLLNKNKGFWSISLALDMSLINKKLF